MIQVTVKNSKTGSQYICKSARRTVKNITYHLICRHKDHPFFKQFYHGPKGIYIDSPRYKEIEALEKPIWNTPIHELLEPTITETPLDGRTRYAKQLPVYNVDVLAEPTYQSIKNNIIMIQFTINSFSHGLTGRPYNSIKDAIQDGGSYSVWCNEKIKLAFSFGNGTEKDFKRYCKDNKCKIVSESEFYKELYSLPLNEQETHIQFK